MIYKKLDSRVSGFKEIIKKRQTCQVLETCHLIIKFFHLTTVTTRIVYKKGLKTLTNYRDCSYCLVSSASKNKKPRKRENLIVECQVLKRL